MKIQWGAVTWYSQLIAIVLFVGVFALGYWLGARAPRTAPAPEALPPAGIKNDVTYRCDDEKEILALYSDGQVELMLSDGRSLILHHAVSASGARYASEDESIVFWNKGTSAWIEEGSSTTFANCEESPIPV